MTAKPITTAALYLRSSKDRHDVSLDAQRRELQDLARAKNLAIVEEFGDEVESGKDDNRPGFQALLKRIKGNRNGHAAGGRTWSVLLALDTSRIARNQYLAHAMHYECEKSGIRIVYAKLPETNTIMDVVIRSMCQAFDQLHSLMSREKGLAGMAENVRQGFRAGGAAPLGYSLEAIPTGAMRDGAPVTKSRLAIAPEGAAVGRYLKARAEGTGRRAAAEAHGLAQINDTTLIGMEWNALTYAGHTVWNMTTERVAGGYKGGRKRRPREDWVIKENTHEPLITAEQAETILRQLAGGRRRNYRTRSDFMLSGLLVAPAKEGRPERPWHGDGAGGYRIGKGRRINAAALERTIVSCIQADIVSPPFVEQLTREARRISAPVPPAELKILRDQVAAATKRIDRLADLAANTTAPRPFLQKIEEEEKRRATAIAELDELERAGRSAELLRAIGPADVERMLAELAANLHAVDREALRAMVLGMVERIELDPDTAAGRLHYRITGELLASPRGFEPRFTP